MGEVISLKGVVTRAQVLNEVGFQNAKTAEEIALTIFPKGSLPPDVKQVEKILNELVKRRSIDAFTMLDGRMYYIGRI